MRGAGRARRRSAAAVAVDDAQEGFAVGLRSGICVEGAVAAWTAAAGAAFWTIWRIWEGV